VRYSLVLARLARRNRTDIRVSFRIYSLGFLFSVISTSLPDSAAMSYGGGYSGGGRSNGFSNGYVFAPLRHTIYTFCVEPIY
jgi:hypothetical protein